MLKAKENMRCSLSRGSLSLLQLQLQLQPTEVIGLFRGIPFSREIYAAIFGVYQARGVWQNIFTALGLR